jgi:pimeloyl-ACP methyl ester carboxylesterase
MDKPTSTGSTAIALDRAGEGPPVILMSGFLDRAENARLAAPLMPRFTVLNYHRRGQGYSGDTQPWAIKREVEDLEAVIARPAGRPCSAVPATGSSPSRRQPADSPPGS